MLLRLLLLLLTLPAFSQTADGPIVWQKSGNLPPISGKANPGVAGAFVGIHEEILIIAGGANFPGKLAWDGGVKVFNRDIFVFQKTGDSLQSVPVSTQLPLAVAYGSSVSTSDGLVCAGGENEGSTLSVVTGIVIMSVVSIFYTVLGGIEAVIWTEVVQVIILLGGAILTLCLIPFLLEGDWQTNYQTLKNYDKLTVFDFSFDWQSSTFWVVLIGGFSLNLIQYGADQTIVQRYLTTKEQKTAEDSLRLGAWLTAPATIIFFSIGTPALPLLPATT